MATYNWYSTPYECAADPSKSHGVGWYSGTTFIASTYKNPTTGLAYTPAELAGLSGGATTPTTTTPTTIPTTSQLEASPSGVTYDPNTGILTTSQDGFTGTLGEWRKLHPGEAIPGPTVNREGITTAPTTPSTIPPITPSIAPTPTIPTISQMEVPQAPTLPPYKPTAELEQLTTQVGGAISGIIAEGGIGIREETKEQLFLREAEIINASTAQAQRNLEDRMAAQGLSDSGMAFSEGMKLASKSTIAMANVMRDVTIQDSLMKIASYQNALGLGVQFLSYLSEESWRQYQPTILSWQATVDMYKMAINDAYTKNNMAIQQAYTQGNITLAHQYEQENLDLAHGYDMEMAQFQAQTQKELAQMEIDAAAKAAAKKNWWDIAGTGLGILAGVTL